MSDVIFHAVFVCKQIDKLHLIVNHFSYFLSHILQMLHICTP